MTIFPILVCAFSLALASSPPAVQPQSSATPIPPYIARGNEVEKKYHDYTARLSTAYDALRSAISRDAPELYKKLRPKPPKPVEFGYQVIPTLTKDAPFEERQDPPRAASTPYSWERTSQFIDWQLPKVDEMREQLKAASKAAPEERRPVYERYIAEYKELEDNQRLVDSHVQYNRFWQKAIAEDRPRFDRLTKLHDLVIQRQAILDKLAIRPDPELGKQEQEMAKAIHFQNSDIRPVSFLKLSHPKPNVWTIEVPLYTDITDRKFLGEVRAVIERLWSFEERERSYKLRVRLKPLTAAALYKGSKPPKKGAHLDVKAHANRFPTDGGIITTGTNSTYAIPGRYIALGPQPISHNVLAHEFGHILGFVDGYFRGYRDLGNQGYEVLEIVPDPDDIMSTPGAGHVRAHHYEKIFSAAAGQNK